MKVLAGILSFVTLVVVLGAGIGTAVNRSEAPQSCYDALVATYSWQYKTDELAKIWEDKHITLGECNEIMKIHKDRFKVEIDKKVQRYVPTV